MKTFSLIISLFCLVCLFELQSFGKMVGTNDSIVLNTLKKTKKNPAVKSNNLFYPSSGVEFVPGEADFDLIKDRLSCVEGDIPLNYNKKVHAFVNYFAIKDREYTRTMVRRKKRYFPIFEKYLKKYGLPDELKYLSIVESGLNPKATSRARAVGLWQFMPATGGYYKLHQDWYIDERMDPEKSTEAACKYLSTLYNMFGDWELALAAYNSGPGNIRKAIRRSGYKRSFWEIYPYLLRETRSYLPQFVAIVYTLKFAEEHNFLEEDLEYGWDYEMVTVDNYLHLKTLAEQIGVCIEDLKRMNPAIKRGALPEKTKGYPLKIPADTYAYFSENSLAILDSAAKVGKKELQMLARNTTGSTYGRSKIYHTVRSGDVLGKIADRYNVRVSDLRKWNNLRGNLIRTGQKLNVWLSPSAQRKINQQVAAATKKVQRKPISGSKVHMVEPGDTLWSISRQYQGLSIEKLKALNNLSNSKIKPGQKLIIG